VEVLIFRALFQGERGPSPVGRLRKELVQSPFRTFDPPVLKMKAMRCHGVKLAQSHTGRRKAVISITALQRGHLKTGFGRSTSMVGTNLFYQDRHFAAQSGSNERMKMQMTQQSERNWWGRNWKWVVPVGSIGALALLAAFIVVILSLVFGMMKSSGAYKEAFALTEEDPFVLAAIGTPLEGGMFVTGKINSSGPSGEADLAIPVSGPGGKATIYAVAEKSAGRWKYSTLVVEIQDTGQRIDLLE
jgi:hypothetical protein